MRDVTTEDEYWHNRERRSAFDCGQASAERVTGQGNGPVSGPVMKRDDDFFDWQPPFKPDGRVMMKVSKAERKLPDFEWDL